MADNDGARLVVTLQAKIDGYTAQLAKANATTLDRASRIEARFAQMEGKLNSSGTSAGRAFDPIAAGAARAASALEQAASRSESAAQRMRRASVGPGPTASALLGSGAVGGGAAGAVAQDVAAAEARIRGASGEMRAALVEVAAAFGEVFAVGKAIEYADQWTRFSNAIHLAGKEGEAFASTQQALLDTANRNGVAIEGVSSLYRQLGLSQKQLGLSDADLIKFTQGFTAAVRVQGTDSKTASYAVLELAHGLDEGKIQARQFNALALEMPVILQAVARHIDGANGSVGKLRQLILGGSVDSRTFAQAFVAASGEVQAQADKAQLTIGASFTTLENHLIEYVGRAGATSGATAAFSQAIVGLADHLDVLAPALAVISTTLGVSYVAGLKAGEGGLIGLAKGAVSAAAAQVAHAGKVLAGTAALNEAAEAELVVARNAKFAAQDEIQARTAATAAIEAEVAALEQQAAFYERNIALAQDALAAGNRERAQAQANAAAGFGAVRVGAGDVSTAVTPTTAGAARSAALEESIASSQALAAVQGKLAAAQGALTDAQVAEDAAMEAGIAVQAAYTGALEATTVASTLAAGAAAAFETALAFVGGPIGAAIIGLTALIFGLAGASGASAKATKEAEDRAAAFQARIQETSGKGAEFAAAIDRLTSAQNATANAAHGAADAFRAQAAAADIATRAVATLTAQERQKRLEEIDRDNTRVRDSLSSTFGVNFANGDITGSGGLRNAQTTTGAVLLRSLGFNGALPGTPGGDAAIGRAQANRGALSGEQQAALVKFEAASGAVRDAVRTLASNDAERTAILRAPGYTPAAGAGKPAIFGGRQGPDYDALLEKAREDQRVANAGPDKRKAVDVDYQANYLEKRKELVGDDTDPAAVAKADAQAKDYAERLRQAQLQTLGQRDAKKGAAAGNRDDAAQRTTDGQVKTAQDQIAKAAEAEAKARADSAEAALQAAASDTGADAQTRAARIRQAASELALADGANDRLGIELKRIEQDRRAQLDEVAHNSALASRRTEIEKAINSSADAQAAAARAQDQARRDQAVRGANQLGAGYRTQALQSVAGDEGLSSDVRAAAERQLVDLAHAEAQARIGEVQAALEAEIAAQQKVVADQEATAAARAAAKAEVSRLSAARDRVPADFQASVDAGASSAGNDELRSLTQERLRGMEELATSTKARAAIERQLLDLEQQARDAQVKALIAQIQASNLPDKDARIKALTSAQGSVDAAENKALDRKSEGPAASYTRGLNQTPDQIDDSLQSAAVDGLKSFNDGLVQSITNAKNLGDVFRDVANQIIGDLARIGIEQEITRPLANAIFGGPGQTGTGLFGTLFGLGSSGPAGGADDSFLSDLLTTLPPRAAGGQVNAGGVYRINESGQELFAPGVRGSMVSANIVRNMNRQSTAGVAGGVTVVQPLTFNAQGAVMTEDLLGQANDFAARAAVSAGGRAYAEARADQGRAARQQRNSLAGY